jgi:hypothetical protein
MPIWLRRFTAQQISNYNQKVQKQIDDTQTSGKNQTSIKPGEAIPEHMKKVFQSEAKKHKKRKPSYTTPRAKK